jgi:hypothetical protein
VLVLLVVQPTAAMVAQAVIVSLNQLRQPAVAVAVAGLAQMSVVTVEQVAAVVVATPVKLAV